MVGTGHFRVAKTLAQMEGVGVDILGLFLKTELGNRYVVVAMDYFKLYF